MRAYFILPLIRRQLLSTRRLGHTNKRCVSNQLKHNYPHNMVLTEHRSSSDFFFLSNFLETGYLVRIIKLMRSSAYAKLEKGSIRSYCFWWSFDAAGLLFFFFFHLVIHAEKNIHVIYELVCIRTMWCHFLHLVPGVNAIMNRWANDMIPLLMKFPPEQEDSALPSCTSDS